MCSIEVSDLLQAGTQTGFRNRQNLAKFTGIGAARNATAAPPRQAGQPGSQIPEQSPSSNPPDYSNTGLPDSNGISDKSARFPLPIRRQQAPAQPPLNGRQGPLQEAWQLQDSDRGLNGASTPTQKGMHFLSARLDCEFDTVRFEDSDCLELLYSNHLRHIIQRPLSYDL